MKSMSVILILSVIPIVILACGENETSVTEPLVAPETTTMPNLSPPVIKDIVVPDQIHAGGRIILEAFAEDPDGNGLEYHWEASGKLIYTKIMAIAVWIPPPMHHLGAATINLTVSDGIHQTTKSVNVNVIPALIVPGQEAAGVRLGDTLDEVIDLYGKPSSVFEKPDEWDYEWDTRIVWHNAALDLYLRNDRVLQIVIGAPNPAQTAEGIGIGTHQDHARRILGPTTGGQEGPFSEPLFTNREYGADGWSFKGIELRYYLTPFIKWIAIYNKQKLHPGTILQPF